MEKEYQNDYLERVKVEEVKLDLHFYITRVYIGYHFIFLIYEPCEYIILIKRY